MDSRIKRYTVLPKTCFDMWVESVGIPKLPDDISDVMVEDVTYRIREAVNNALQVMKHCKRTCLTVDDFNNALKESNTEPIYGHGGVDSLSFKAISYKDGRVCYVDEKEVNLREAALESVYPTDPGEISVKANWLVLEGQSYSVNNKSKDEQKSQLSEVISSYLDNITSALIDESPNLRKIALNDLVENKKLQVILPHLVTFFSTQIKLHTGKNTFSLMSSLIIPAINALVENTSILLTPYVFQLVKIMLYIIIEAQLPVYKWTIKDKAAQVLCQLCRKHTSTLYNLHAQLLKSYQDSLNDQKRTLTCLYGSIVGIKTLGVDAIHRVLYPVIREKLQIIDSKCEKATDANELLEILTVRSVITDAVAMVFSTCYSMNPPLKNINIVSQEICESLGEELLCRCVRVDHELAQNGTKNGLNLKIQIPIAKRSNSTTMLIEKELEKINSDEPMETVRKETSTCVCSMGDVVSTYSWKEKLKENALEEFSTLDNFASRNKHKKYSLDIRKHRGSHCSYQKLFHKNILQELTSISSFLPV